MRSKLMRAELKGKGTKSTDCLSTTTIIKSPIQLNNILSSLEKSGYEVYNNDIDNLFEKDDKPGYKHIAIKLVKKAKAIMIL